MPTGTIKKLTDKGFGFIAGEDGKDMFFHMSSVEGTSFDSLQEGQAVTFNTEDSPKGPRAVNVTLAA